MNNPAVILLAIIALCIPLFGLIIFFGLKSRKADLEQWLNETNAQLVEAKLPLHHLSLKTLLYGNFYDASSTQVGFVVRNRNDIEVGRVNYEIGAISIEVDKKRFQIFNEMKSHYHISIRPLKGEGMLEPPIAECISKGIFSKKYIYRFENYGEVEFKFTHFGRRAAIMKEGAMIGECFRLGPYELSGKALMLSVDVPLIYQLILLAGPFTRRMSVPY